MPFPFTTVLPTEVPGIPHFERHTGAAFETSSNAVADWFLEPLGAART